MEIGGNFLIEVGVSLAELCLLEDGFCEGFPVKEVTGGLVGVGKAGIHGG